MTPQEHSLLEDFLARLAAVGPLAKDAEADALIRARLDGRPDAAYLLVQRALLLERALVEANAQIALLRQTTPAGGSFLGGAAATPPEGFGRAPSQTYAPEPSPAAAAAAFPSTWRSRWFGAAPTTPQAPVAQPAPSAGPSLLGQAATTAAGVAGGMFLFNGIEHLLGSGNNHAGLGSSNGLFGGNDNTALHDTMVQNINENVFLDNDRNSGSQGLFDSSGDDWSSSQNDDYPDGGSSFI